MVKYQKHCLRYLKSGLFKAHQSLVADGKKKEEKLPMPSRRSNRSIDVFILISPSPSAWNVQKKKKIVETLCFCLSIFPLGTLLLLLASSFSFGHFTFKIISRHLNAWSPATES